MNVSFNTMTAIRHSHARSAINMTRSQE